MPTRHPAHTARGLSARQWQDIRQAARIARSEGAELILHGVKVSADNGRLQVGQRPGQQQQQHEQRQQQQQQQRQQRPRQPQSQPSPLPQPPQPPPVPPLPPVEPPNETEPQQDGGEQLDPMDTSGPAPAAAAPNRRQRRDAQRTQARHRALLWLSLARRAHAHATWTAWMRARLAVRRLKGLLWQEWTRRFIPSGAGLRALGLFSHRDRYIYMRAGRLYRQMPELAEFTFDRPSAPAARRGLVFGQRLRDLFRRAWHYADGTVEGPDGRGVKHPVLGYMSLRDFFYFERAHALQCALPELKDILIFGGRAHSERVWQAMIKKGIDPRTQTPLAAAGSGSRARTRSLAKAGIPPTPTSARARKKRGKRG